MVFDFQKSVVKMFFGLLFLLVAFVVKMLFVKLPTALCRLGKKAKTK